MKTTCCISLYGIPFFFRYMAVCRPIYYRQMSKRSSGLHRYREISPILEEIYLVLQGIPITVSHFLCWALIFIFFYASRLKCRWRRVAIAMLDTIACYVLLKKPKNLSAGHPLLANHMGVGDTYIWEICSLYTESNLQLNHFSLANLQVCW